MNEITVYCGTDHMGSTNALYNDGRVAATASATVKASVSAKRATTSQDKPAR
jgi:prepilin-type processing-associated H-X9-DG protein